jgi:hypothetical protein
VIVIVEGCMSARLRRILALAGALALTAAALTACGDDGERRLLSRTKASELRSALSQVEETAAAGDCAAAGQHAAELSEQVSSLSARVDRDLRAALEDGASRLETLVASRCEERTVETPDPVVTPEPSGTTDQGQSEEGTGEDEQGQGKDKDKELPPGQEKKVPDDQQDSGSGGTELTPEGSSGGTEDVTP